MSKDTCQHLHWKAKGDGLVCSNCGLLASRRIQREIERTQGVMTGDSRDAGVKSHEWTVAAQKVLVETGALLTVSRVTSGVGVGSFHLRKWETERLLHRIKELLVEETT